MTSQGGLPILIEEGDFSFVLISFVLKKNHFYGSVVQAIKS